MPSQAASTILAAWIWLFLILYVPDLGQPAGADSQVLCSLPGGVIAAALNSMVLREAATFTNLQRVLNRSRWLG